MSDLDRAPGRARWQQGMFSTLGLRTKPQHSLKPFVIGRVSIAGVDLDMPPIQVRAGESFHIETLPAHLDGSWAGFRGRISSSDGELRALRCYPGTNRPVVSVGDVFRELGILR